VDSQAPPPNSGLISLIPAVVDAYSPSGLWPTPNGPEVFRERRRMLGVLCSGTVALAAGWARPRNFPHNCYPFRAESHFLYFIGRSIEGALLVLRDGAATLYVPPSDPADAIWHGPKPSVAELEASLGLDVRPLAELELPSSTRTIPPQDPRAAAWLGALLGRELAAGTADRLTGLDAELADVIIRLRLVQDSGALDQLRQSARATAAAHRAGMLMTQPGLREAEVAAAMRAAIGAAGMELSYSPIVTVHGEVLHAHGHEGQLGDNDLLLCDVGAESIEGWSTDVTRTWPVCGKFSPTQRDAYEAVLSAQRAALNAVAPGVRYKQVHLASMMALTDALVELKILRGSVEALLAAGATALFYPHGVGHLLGLDVHDMEDLGDRAGYAPGRQRTQEPGLRYLRLDRDLVPGMVVTIEPGFYQIPGLLSALDQGGPLAKMVDRTRLAQFSDVRGIRIEDDVLVTEGGCEVLTREIAKNVGEIEALVGNG
jgi:Xaa-Pro aminopeptidase